MKVVNIKSIPSNWKSDMRYKYIGRPSGSSNEHYGNPFTHRLGTKASVPPLTSREEAV